MSIRRGIRAILIGTLVCMLCYIYLPHCGLKVASEDVTIVSFGLAGISTVLIYRFS